MRNLADLKKNLQDRIAAAISRLDSHRQDILAGKTGSPDALWQALQELNQLTANLRYLEEIPEEKTIQPEPVIVPFIASAPAPPAVPLVPQPVMEIKTETPVPPPVKVPEPPVPQPVKEPVPPVVPPAPVVVPAEKTNTAAPRKTTDIRSFIGFNEKLMFVRNLFRSDNQAYEDALNQLNSCSSFAEAGTFLDVLGKEYAWDKGKEAVQIFTDTVKRRFS